MNTLPNEVKDRIEMAAKEFAKNDFEQLPLPAKELFTDAPNMREMRDEVLIRVFIEGVKWWLSQPPASVEVESVIEKLIVYFEQQLSLQRSSEIKYTGEEAYFDAVDVCKNAIKIKNRQPKEDKSLREALEWILDFCEGSIYIPADMVSDKCKVALSSIKQSKEDIEMVESKEPIREVLIELLDWYNGRSQRRDIIQKNVDTFLNWYKDYKPLFTKKSQSNESVQQAAKEYAEKKWGDGFFTTKQEIEKDFLAGASFNQQTKK